MAAQRTFSNYLQTSLSGTLLLFYFNRLFEFDLPYELLRRLELLADLRILRLDCEHLLQISNGQLRFEYLYMTHCTAAGHPGGVQYPGGCLSGCRKGSVKGLRCGRTGSTLWHIWD